MYMLIVVGMSIGKPNKAGSPRATRAGNLPQAIRPSRIASSSTAVVRRAAMVPVGVIAIAVVAEWVAAVGQEVVAAEGASD